MNRILLLCAILIIGIKTSFAQDAIMQPRVLFAVERFYHPEAGPYIELYLSFDASSLTHKMVDDTHYQAKLEIGYLIKKNQKIVKYDKYEVLGPLMESASMRQDFADMKTVVLPSGEYTIEIMVKDANQDYEGLDASQLLTIDLDRKTLSFSDFVIEKHIEKTEEQGPFIKNGLSMTPWLVTTIPSYLEKVYLYTEVYNSDYTLGKTSAYIEKHTLTNLDVDSVFSDYSSMKRTNSNPVNVIIKSLDVTSLPQGGYIYDIELYNRDNEMVATNSTQFFIESEIPPLSKTIEIQSVADFDHHINSITNRDSLVDYFRCIRPLGDFEHQSFIDKHWKQGANELLKSYIVDFWKEREPANPFQTWLNYRALVAKVDKEFGTSAQPGYDTDRGMVYLQYGAPNQIVNRENEPSSYPYIIWQYYQHPLQSNAMYVFYDPTLTFRNYTLLYSNVRGEKNNPRWKLELQKRNNPDGDLDKNSGVDHWGGEVDDYYSNPR